MALAASLDAPRRYPDAPGRDRRRVAPAHALAALGYVAAGVALLWPAVSACTTTVYGPRGDATAGELRVAWLLSQVTNPFTGWTSWTAAPAGEVLWAPQWWASTVVLLPLWALSHVTTAACAVDLTVLAGLVASALAAFALAAAVVRRRSVAFVAGLAWGYSAFHQAHAQAHVGLVHTWSLPLIALAVLRLWAVPSVRRAVVLGLLVAVAAHTDPYLLLLAPVTALAVAGALALAGRRRRDTAPPPPGPRRRALVVAGLVAGLVAGAACLPLAAVLLTHRSEGAALVDRPGADDAATWSASLTDFLWWPRAHPVLGELGAAWRDERLTGNTTEKTLSLGFGVVALGVAGAVVALRRRRDDPTPVGLPLAAVGAAGVALLAAGLWASLPPRLPVPGLSTLRPVLPWWRVFARFGTVAHLGAVLLAAVGLDAVLAAVAPRRRLAVLAAVATVVVFESLTVPPAPMWSVADAPAGYRWLAAQDDVRTIAEYPLDSPRAAPDNPFVTFQPVHGKRLLNATLPTAASVPLQEAMAGLGDPQTPGLLAALGVDRAVVHRLLYPGMAGTGALPDGYRLVHRVDVGDAPAATAQERGDRAMAVMDVLAPAPVAPAEVAAGIGLGFDPPRPVGWRTVTWTRGSGRLPVLDLAGGRARATVSFTLRAALGVEDVVVTTGGDGGQVVGWHGRVGQDDRVPVTVEVATGGWVEVRATGPAPADGDIRVGIEDLSAAVAG